MSLTLTQPAPLAIDPLPAPGTRPAHAARSGRCLPAMAPSESPWERWWCRLLALALVLGFFHVHRTYWVPAHSGVDQNGYLVGGRMMASSLSTRLDATNPETHQVDPFIFVGRMWVGADLGTPAERFYPKYPIGMPALIAGALKLGGPRWGVALTYWINPICMTLAVAATYLLVRTIAGGFAGFLGACAFAASPVTFAYTTNPNSHATTAFCVTWGMFLLIRWWQARGAWRAVLAGLLLGYAATIRYTEVLLALPLAIVALQSMRWRQLRSWLETGLLLAWWAMPVLILACFNLKAMGTLTGYDPTNESKGFAWEYLATNWYTALHQLNDTGLMFVFPLSLAGLVWMFWWNWKLALVLASWIVPSTLAYAFYYWAPDGQTTGYMRFFLSIFPGLILCGYWLLSRIPALTHDPKRLRGLRSVSAGAAGLLTIAAIAVGLEAALPPADADQYARLYLERNATEITTAIAKARAAERDQIHDRIESVFAWSALADSVADQLMACRPEQAVVFAQDDGLLHHLQFATDHRCYSLAMFNYKSVSDLLTNLDPDQPQGLDPNRRKALDGHIRQLVQARVDQPLDLLSESRRAEETQAMLLAEERRIMTLAREAGRSVYFVGPAAVADQSLRIADPRKFQTRVVSMWSYGMAPPVKRDAKLLGRPNKPIGKPGQADGYQPAFWKVMEVRLKSAGPFPPIADAPSAGQLERADRLTTPDGSGKPTKVFKPLPPNKVK